MNSFEIFKDQEWIGSLTASPEGLYCQYCAQLPEMQEFVRVYLVFPDGTVSLGTALPEEGGLCCRRRLSLRQAPADQLAGAFALGQEVGAWQDSEAGGRVCFSPDGVQVAQLAAEDVPLQDPTAYPDLTPREIDGKTYLVRSYSWAAYLELLKNPPQPVMEPEEPEEPEEPAQPAGPVEEEVDSVL